MCEPMTIAAFAGLALSAVGQVQQANAQEDALEATAEQAAAETGAKIQQETGQRVAQARRERSRLIVAAGESGIAANSGSFEAQIANSFARQNRDLALISKNARFSESGINAQSKGQASQIRSGLQIAGSTISGAASIQAGRPSKPTSP